MAEATATKVVPWSEATGRYGMVCTRIREQYESGRRKALLPLTVIPEEEIPGVGQKVIILQAPVRGFPYWIKRIELCRLADITNAHLEEMGVDDRSAWLEKWDECTENPKHVAANNPEIMLLWLEANY